MKGRFKSPKCKVLNQPDVKDTLHKLYVNYILVLADKAANDVIVVCKKYHIDTLVKELGINNVNSNSPTYITIDDSFEIIVKSHNNFITSVGLEMSEEDQNLPYLYWTPKLQKSPYKHRFYGWLKHVYNERPVLPPYQATKYHKGWIGEVLQH